MDWNGRTYTLAELCERVHLSTATALAVYQKDFYAGEAAFSVNEYGAGQAFYLAAGAEAAFYRDFYQVLATGLSLEAAIDARLPDGVTATRRIGAQTFAILQNYNNGAMPVLLSRPLRDYETNELYTGKMVLAPYEVKIVVAE
jgi:beta-galactosidase